MRAQVTIEHSPLSSGMRVTVLDNGDDGMTVDTYSVDRDDAEYQLLAQAVDRFVRVQSVIKAGKEAVA